MVEWRGRWETGSRAAAVGSRTSRLYRDEPLPDKGAKGEIKMQYRTNRRTGDQISVIGIGTAYLPEAPEKEAVEALQYAHAHGINYADLATADA